MTLLTSTDQFLACVRQCQLVAEKQLDAYLEDLGDALPDQAEQLADRLLQDGLLTGFQVRQLLQSRWQGFLLGGKYRILELLGAGGMGRVFLCLHLRMQTLVAVKVLPPEKLSEPAALERFEREARAAASLVHPNLVRAFDIDQDGPFHFLVMEFVHGTSLQQLVRKNGPLPIARASDCIRQAAVGLQHAHEQGLIHRDVKPGNILLDHQGTIKILDLGLAKFFRDTGDRLTAKYDEGSILGTVDYLSPEQALGSQEVTTQSDVYSLGATFFFLLTGRAPFEDGSLAQKMIWHQIRQPPAPSSLRGDVPAEIEAVVLRMLAKEPARRFAAISEVAQALAPWTRGPLPPPDESDLPSYCPAVRRLLGAAPGSIATHASQPTPPNGAEVRQTAGNSPLDITVLNEGDQANVLSGPAPSITAHVQPARSVPVFLLEHTRRAAGAIS